MITLGLGRGPGSVPAATMTRPTVFYSMFQSRAGLYQQLQNYLNDANNKARAILAAQGMAYEGPSVNATGDIDQTTVDALMALSATGAAPQLSFFDVRVTPQWIMDNAEAIVSSLQNFLGVSVDATPGKTSGGYPSGGCPAGTVLDPTGTCVLPPVATPPTPIQPPAPATCEAAGLVTDPVTGACVAATISTPGEPSQEVPPAGTQTTVATPVTPLAPPLAPPPMMTSFLPHLSPGVKLGIVALVAGGIGILIARRHKN